MSASAAARTAIRPAERAVPRASPGTAEPRLRVVPGRPGNGSPVALAALCLLMLIGGLVALLMVNISLGHGSYELNRLQREGDRLAEQRAALSDGLAQRAAPRELEREARRYGMVPADDVSFISLKDGKVIGAGKSRAGRR